MKEHTKKDIIQRIVNKFPKSYREDLFQECYIQLSTLLESYDDSLASFKTYSYKRLYFTCVDYLNKYQNNNISLDESFYDDDGEGTTKADLIESDLNLDSQLEANDRLTIHFNKLSERDKLIQQLYYIEDLSVQDILEFYYSKHLIKSSKTIYKIINKK
ncbi:hypothetical protein AAU57_08875 [Nonlabens sp. YIK11]|uniref:sigma-70 family RNA polymerase sigma factor n=1 Tax=Nonlabens sp. YIK11 TaxID=1453349 RepID=UPI0006DD0172|nr:sigma-70 family RNA polymerase sigma factor [Nonlabens sp. YIK11]KQC33416.1 hypothetical protein AAU57_08875 [Nonlabens sp. YIK11]